MDSQLRIKRNIGDSWKIFRYTLRWLFVRTHYLKDSFHCCPLSSFLFCFLFSLGDIGFMVCDCLFLTLLVSWAFDPNLDKLFKIHIVTFTMSLLNLKFSHHMSSFSKHLKLQINELLRGSICLGISPYLHQRDIMPKYNKSHLLTAQFLYLSYSITPSIHTLTSFG